MSFQFINHKFKLNINQFIALAFLCIILIGTFLLSLPISTKDEVSHSIITSLFTATSSVCVTGLSVTDIWSTYTYFGQTVILILMEIGGLGFMSIVAILIYISKHHTDIPSLSLMAESLGTDTLKNIVRIQKRLLIGSLIFEFTGALLLFLNFISSLGIPRALWFGIFHSVSAFCNGGFDLMGIMQPGSSLETFQNNPAVLVTISFLIIVGGIGFIVWDDIVSSKHIRNWSIYTKLVLTTTTLLIGVGSILFLFFEFNNNDTIGNMQLVDKISNAFFQSVTTRTAGFAAINQNSLTDSSIVLTIILMIIGGSTGSTAGGIKTVTFAIIFSTILSSIRGNKNTLVFKRRLSASQIIQAYSLLSCFIIISLISSLIIQTASEISFTQGFFESASALATVGLSLGITGGLPYISQIVLIILMYIGRVGLLTLTVGFLKPTDNTSIQYPSVKLLIG